MTGPEPRRRTGALVLAVAALVAVAYTATAGRRETEATTIPPQAVGWYGAWEMYRTVALWAGRRAMDAELNYWKAVG